MVNVVKQGYVNPLAMMKQGKQTNHFQTVTVKNAEKRQKELETEKQSIQNSLLLMKGTSGDSGASKENIALLEKRLEEVTAQMKARQQKIQNQNSPQEEQKIKNLSRNDKIIISRKGRNYAAKAYGDIYNEIVQGYQNGAREI